MQIVKPQNTWEKCGFHNPITPFDLILSVSVYELIVEVSKIKLRKPTEDLMCEVAQKLAK